MIGSPNTTFPGKEITAEICWSIQCRVHIIIFSDSWYCQKYINQAWLKCGQFNLSKSFQSVCRRGTTCNLWKESPLAMEKFYFGPIVVELLFCAWWANFGFLSLTLFRPCVLEDSSSLPKSMWTDLNWGVKLINDPQRRTLLQEETILRSPETPKRTFFLFCPISSCCSFSKMLYRTIHHNQASPSAHFCCILGQWGMVCVTA